jgi:hypothetical protein
MAGSYILEGKAGELRNHVNHQIEVTGRLDSKSGSNTQRGGTTAGSTASGTTTASTAPGTTTSTAGTSPSGVPGAMDAQHLQVESVRMIAATCSAR